MQRQKAAQWVWAASAALCLGSAMSRAADVSSAFSPGEQATYRVKYLGITAGSAQVTVGAEMTQWGKTVWPIVAFARSEALLGIWPIRDKFISYWDATASRTIGHELFADENRKRRRQRVQLDADARLARILKQHEGGPREEFTRELDPTTLDMASATFSLRNSALDIGKTYEFPVFTGTKTFTLKATVEGKETVESSMGRRECFKLRVQTAFDGKFTAKRDISVWLSTDASHLPVKLEADFALGSLVAELTDYKPGRTLTQAPTPATTPGGATASAVDSPR